MSGLGAALHARMTAAGVTHLVSVANGEGKGLWTAFREDPTCTVVEACREGEAVGICAGLYLGGQLPVLSMENFGLFECLDTLRALPLALNIPVVLVIGYTGRPALTPEGEAMVNDRYRNIAAQAILGAKWTEPMLATAGIPAWHIAPDGDPALFDEAHAEAVKQSCPVAILVDMT
jgi:sulfopyruvate decarboxylase TPP-binding subunit